MILMLLGGAVPAVIALRLAWRRLPGAVAPLILTHTDRVASIILMLAFISTWIGGYAGSLLASGSEPTIWLYRVSFLGVAGTPPAILAVALDATRQSWRSARSIAAISFVPLVTMVLALTSDHHGWLWASSVVEPVGTLTALDTVQGEWFWVHTVFSYGALAAAFLTLARAYARAPRDYAREGIALGVAFLAPWAINVAYMASGFSATVDPTPAGLLITALLFYRVLRGTHFADLVPVAWNTVIETLGDPILVVDGDARVLDANPAARRLLDPEGPESEEFSVELTRLLQSESQRDGGELVVGKDPERRHSYDVRISAVSPPMSTVRIRVVAIRDVTKQLRREEQRRALESRLHHAQRLESIGVLAGGIAHDFNNLLTAILSSSEQALNEVPEGHPARSSIELAIHGSERAAELTNELLAYAGKGRLQMQTIDLTRCVRELAPLATAAISKKVSVHTQLPSDLPCIDGDPAQIQQVVMNLILNAAESYGEDQGVVRVTVGTAEVREADRASFVEAREMQPGGHVYVEVADRGCGMDEERQGRIFEPFFAANSTGRGLGLSAVLGIVRGHRGAIALSSEPGRGTRVRVLIPAGVGVAPAAGGADEASGRAGSGCVLVVDDDPLVRSAAKNALRSFGYAVLLAEHGQEALEVFRTRRDEVDVVLLDMTMPDLSGVEVLGVLRRECPGLPVVLSSGYTDADVGGALTSDTTSFLGKPYKRRELADAIERVLRPPGAAGG